MSIAILENISTTDYFLKDTLLYNLVQLCVPTGEHRQKLIWDMHYSKTSWHFGVTKTLVILQKYFSCPSLKSDVNKYIQSCVVCTIAKPSKWRQRLYTPLLVPTWPWESIYMDYLTGYPTTKHQHDAILVVVDRFSKMALLIPCKKTTTTHQTLQLFFEHMVEKLWPFDDHYFWQRC